MPNDSVSESIPITTSSTCTLPSTKKGWLMGISSRPVESSPTWTSVVPSLRFSTSTSFTFNLSGKPMRTFPTLYSRSSLDLFRYDTTARHTTSCTGGMYSESGKPIRSSNSTTIATRITRPIPDFFFSGCVICSFCSSMNYSNPSNYSNLSEPFIGCKDNRFFISRQIFSQSLHIFCTKGRLLYLYRDSSNIHCNST